MNEIVRIQRKRARIAAHDELKTRRCKALRKAENKIRHKARTHGRHDRRFFDIEDDSTRYPD